MLTRTQNFINLVDLRNRCSYQMLETRKPMFDNEFMSVIQRQTGKLSIVFTSALRNEQHSDAVMVFNLPSKFVAGIVHFGTQPTLEEI